MNVFMRADTTSPSYTFLTRRNHSGIGSESLYGPPGDQKGFVGTFYARTSSYPYVGEMDVNYLGKKVRITIRES